MGSACHRAISSPLCAGHDALHFIRLPASQLCSRMLVGQHQRLCPFRAAPCCEFRSRSAAQTTLPCFHPVPKDTKGSGWAARQHLEPVALLDVLEHVPARRVLHGNSQVRGGEEDLLELDDVRVAEVAVADDLALHVLGDLVGPLRMRATSTSGVQGHADARPPLAASLVQQLMGSLSTQWHASWLTRVFLLHLARWVHGAPTIARSKLVDEQHPQHCDCKRSVTVSGLSSESRRRCRSL